MSMLSVNNIEVVYNHVILALHGVTLDVEQGKIVSLLGANGAGKSTTLKACSNILPAERGEITKGSVHFDGQNNEGMQPTELVKNGCIQVLEGRLVFRNLTVEENLLSGSFIRENRAQAKEDLEKVYTYLPRLAHVKDSVAGYTSGGEQQMLAMGRALMSRPTLMLLDEPSMGLSPQIVEEIFQIVETLNKEGMTFLIAEQNATVALRYADSAYVIENGRVVMKGAAKELLARDDVKEAYLGLGEEGRVNFRDVKYYHRRKPSFS